MPSFNQVTLVGNLSKDPLLSFLESQTAVCNFGIAVNDSFTNKAGTKIENVCFVDCAIFGKRAEALNKYLKKGDPLLVTGKLVLENWLDKENVKHYKHKIQVREFSFIGHSKKGGNDENKS